MVALEEKIEQLESELAEIKVQIHAVLIDLKDLVLRDQDPLADPAPIQDS